MIHRQFSVSKVVNIGPDLLELFENIKGVWNFFESQCSSSSGGSDGCCGSECLLYSVDRRPT